jgi:hypothetical protein
MITTSGGGGSSAVVAAAAARYIQTLLADRTSLRGHPALINLGAYGAGMIGSGSTAYSFPLFGLDGYDLMGAVSEGSAITETTLTSAARTITVARRGLRRDLSDLMHSVDASGALNPVRLAQDGFVSALVTLTNLIAALASGFSSRVGTSGVDFDHDVWLEAKATLVEAKVPGPYIAVLHPNHFSRWQIDLEARGGLTQWSAAAANMQQLKGPGFQGLYDGIEVYTSDKCPASSSDYISMMFGTGAIGYVEQEIKFPASAIVLLQAGPIAVEEVRNGEKGATEIITHYYCGVTEIEDGRGVGMLAAG